MLGNYTSAFISNITTIDIIIFILNLLIFLFGKKIFSYLDVSTLKSKVRGNDEKRINQKVKMLQGINIILAISYIFTGIVDSGIQNFILFLFSILVFYIISAFGHKQLVLFYGEEKEINGNIYFKESSVSEIFSLLQNIILFLILIYSWLVIFDLTILLQSGGIIGGLLAFIGFTASIWAPDLYAGLLILHSSRLRQNDVIKYNEGNGEKIAWIKSINLLEVKLIDLVTEDSIIIKTSRFRNLVIQNISTGIPDGKREIHTNYIDLNIGYGSKLEEVSGMCKESIELLEKEILENKSLELLKKSIPRYKGVTIVKNGDFSVTFRFFYTITKAMYCIKLRNKLNEFLYEESIKRNLSLATPILEEQINK